MYNFTMWPKLQGYKIALLSTPKFFNATNTEIISAIEHDKSILEENGGHFSDDQLENYLGDFEMIATAYKQDLLSEDDLCRSFSYYASNAADNSEIQKYIEDTRKFGASFFRGFSQVVKIVRRSKNKNCR